MLRMLATRFLCLCLALMVAMQLAVPMAGATNLPCHAADAVMASGDAPAPCPAPDPVCPGKGCLSHAFALPAPEPRLPAARDIPAPAARSDVSALRPMQMVGDLLRPPNP